MKKIAKLNLLLILVYSLSACSYGQRIEITEPVTTLVNETCIDSFDNFAFSTPDIDGPTQEAFLPGNPWQEASILPKEVQEGDYNIAAIRSSPGKVEIWAQPYQPSGIYSADDQVNDFWVFKTNEQTWYKISSQVEGSHFFVDKLFITIDGSVWGRNVWEKTENVSNSPVLSRYNDTTNRFEPIPDTSQIPNGVTGIDRNATQWPQWDTILLDSSNIFWFFVYEDGIFSYDPVTSVVTRHASLTNFPKIAQVTLAPDGSIFIRIQTGEYTLRDGQIYRYTPKTDVIEPIALPHERWPAANSILADHTDRLWLGAFGWQEPNGDWKLLHPQIKKFIQLNQKLPLWRYYQPPSVFMASSDGRMWFSIPRSEEWKTLRSGIAWYDPGRNEGCWFTTEGYNVVEDSNETIWLIANRKLYRYSLNP